MTVIHTELDQRLQIEGSLRVPMTVAELEGSDLPYGIEFDVKAERSYDFGGQLEQVSKFFGGLPLEYRINDSVMWIDFDWQPSFADRFLHFLEMNYRQATDFVKDPFGVFHFHYYSAGNINDIESSYNIVVDGVRTDFVGIEITNWYFNNLWTTSALQAALDDHDLVGLHFLNVLSDQNRKIVLDATFSELLIRKYKEKETERIGSYTKSRISSVNEGHVIANRTGFVLPGMMPTPFFMTAIVSVSASTIALFLLINLIYSIHHTRLLRYIEFTVSYPISSVVLVSAFVCTLGLLFSFFT